MFMTVQAPLREGSPPRPPLPTYDATKYEECTYSKAYELWTRDEYEHARYH